jgi:Ca2+-binding EF-hand superfamily protein
MLGLIVDFETFSKILNRPGGFRDPGEPEEYCRGFQVFDKDMTGFIGVGQLRYILTNLGEKMSDEEVDELLKAVDTSSGEINYTGMCLFPVFRFGENSGDEGRKETRWEGNAD